MTIIDKYISDNYQVKPAAVMSNELGLNYKYVQARITRIRKDKLSGANQNMKRSEEVRALNLLISTRVSGWAVEIAKERIRKLEQFGDEL
ncbi:hypothetical protein [Pedobacter antarcticus]|uniref:hypothetical protein n=1 Tax=Pedobacter antarcticus TaxID=34086 RepID=UPI00292F6CEB|nr:hypothetical protein [Pedobacter antarcticus]